MMAYLGMANDPPLSSFAIFLAKKAAEDAAKPAPKLSVAKINPVLEMLFKKSKHYEERGDDDRKVAHLRVSKKALWFLAYRAKEATGEGFSMDGTHGYVGYPTAFKVGAWDDGSPVTAEATANNINGPFWIRYPLSLTS